MDSGGKGFGSGSRGKQTPTSFGSGNRGQGTGGYGNANLPLGQNQLPFMQSNSRQGSTRFSSNSTYGDAHADLGNMFPSTPYTAAADLFMSPQLRNKFQSAPAVTARNTTVASAKFAHFTAITNVDDKAVQSALHRDLHTQVYRTTNRFSGKHVLLRRVMNATASAADCTSICERLRHFRHPSLVPLHSITPTTEFVLGSRDIIVEHRLIKRAKSVEEAFFGATRPAQMVPVNPSDNSGPLQQQQVTEGLLWSIACQLVGLLKMFHDAQTPLRGLHLSKLMFQDVLGRIYFTGLGLMDLADPHASNATLETLLKYDVRQVGVVLYQLATLSLTQPPVAATAASNLRLRYSPAFAQLVATSLEGGANVDQLCRGLGDRLAMEVGHQCGHVDYLFHECAKEVHNGRLMRLMIKLNFAVESMNSDPATTPDDPRMILRMFNQYVFNQVDEQNRVRADWGHVFHTLNKLDCSADELIQLISSDASTVMVISFRDVRLLLDRVFELTTAPALEMSFTAVTALQNNAMTPPTVQQAQ